MGTSTLWAGVLALTAVVVACGGGGESSGAAGVSVVPGPVTPVTTVLTVGPPTPPSPPPPPPAPPPAPPPVATCTPLDLPSTAPAITYASPLVITKGGSYSGNYESLQSGVAAITVRTSEPVVIENVKARSRGRIIEVAAVDADVTVRNVQGWGLTPTVANQSQGRFFAAEGVKNIVLENNDMVQTSGVYLNLYRGNQTAAQTVRLMRNRARNIDGRRPDGGQETVQFAQLNALTGLQFAAIGWNEVINAPGQSLVEDNISIYKSNGTTGSPIAIHDNYIFGAYPRSPDTDSYTGGGIMAGDGEGTSTADSPGNVQVYGNTLVNIANYGIAASNGYNIAIVDNRVTSSGRRHDGGAAIASANVGIYVVDSEPISSVNYFNVTVKGNRIGYAHAVDATYPRGRNDMWLPGCRERDSCYALNTEIPGPITVQMEKEEYPRWTAKLAAANIKVGALPAGCR